MAVNVVKFGNSTFPHQNALFLSMSVHSLFCFLAYLHNYITFLTMEIRARTSSAFILLFNSRKYLNKFNKQSDIKHKHYTSPANLWVLEKNVTLCIKM